MINYTLDTLEKLCHFNETAEEACLLLYKLANTDVDYTKEAKEAFSDLFYIALAETTISLTNRIEILNRIKEEFGITEILIDSYRKSLKATSFIGKVRNANETFKRNYYLPNNSEENQKYFRNSILKLKEFVISENEFSNYAKKAFFSQLSEQVYNGERILMLQSLNEIISHEGKIETEIRNTLLQYSSEGNYLGEEANKLINEILERFKPQNIEEEIKAIVIEAPWIYSKREQGFNENLSAIKAGELATKYCNDGTHWLDNLRILLKGEQRQTFYFAQKIGEFYKNKDKIEILEKLFNLYKEIPVEEQNSLFINGFVNGINDNDFTRTLISKMLTNELTERLGILQIRFLNPIKFDDIDQVKDKLKEKPNYFKDLQYLKLKSFTKEEFENTINWIKEVNYSFAVEMLYEVTRSDTDNYDKDVWSNYKDLVGSILYQKNILKHSNFYNSSYHIEVLFIISINENPLEANIKFLVEEIINEYCDFNSKNNSLLDRLTFYLLEEYWDISWKYYGDFLSSKKGFSFGLDYFLQRYKFNDEKLSEWVKGNPELNSPIAIKYMQFYNSDPEGNLSWNPYSLDIINNFGNNRLVLESLSSRLYSYSINTYSAENLYKQRKKLVEQLLDNKFPEVIEFAKNEISHLEKRIEEERRFGENYELGR